MNDVVTLGETMALLQPMPDGPVATSAVLHHSIAGAESNLAIGLSRLGRSVGFLSRVGDDPFGQAIRTTLAGEGVGVAKLAIDPSAPTGIVVRQPGRSGEPSVFYHRRGSAASQLDEGDIDANWLEGVRLLALTGITPALSSGCRRAVFAAIELAHELKIPITFDPNIRFKLWGDRHTARRVIGDIASRCDVVTPGAAEASFLTDTDDAIEAGRRLVVGRTELVAVKLGPTGSVAISDSVVVSAPASKVLNVVDPIGAGDAWAAGFVSILLEMEPDRIDPSGLVRALERANLMGALTTMFRGDWEGLPQLAELQRIERGEQIVSR